MAVLWYNDSICAVSTLCLWAMWDCQCYLVILPCSDWPKVKADCLPIIQSTVTWVMKLQFIYCLLCFVWVNWQCLTNISVRSKHYLIKHFQGPLIHHANLLSDMKDVNHCCCCLLRPRHKFNKWTTDFLGVYMYKYICMWILILLYFFVIITTTSQRFFFTCVTKLSKVWS